jgi:hypothetical protein
MEEPAALKARPKRDVPGPHISNLIGGLDYGGPIDSEAEPLTILPAQWRPAHVLSVIRRALSRADAVARSKIRGHLGVGGGSPHYLVAALLIHAQIWINHEYVIINYDVRPEFR